ncbi:hypothetical protein ANO14919_014440 [Xylariales sp. No.14919]|nr:hypothetical protein ANO14919_014440 [Xylariales sp. No.14919]
MKPGIAFKKIFPQEAKKKSRYLMTACGKVKISKAEDWFGTRDENGKRMFTSEGKIRGDHSVDSNYDVKPKKKLGSTRRSLY